MRYIVLLSTVFFVISTFVLPVAAQTTDEGTIQDNPLEFGEGDRYIQLKNKGNFWEEPSFGLKPWSSYRTGSIPKNIIRHLNTQNYARASFLLRHELYDSFSRPNKEAWLVYPRALLGNGDYRAAIRASYKALQFHPKNVDALAVLTLALLVGRENTEITMNYFKRLEEACARCTITHNIAKLLSDVEATKESAVEEAS